MIISKLLKKDKFISHGFFNRKGGVSKGIYKSLNCGLGSKDNKKNIQLNLKKVCKDIGCSKNNLMILKQVHSSKILFIRNKFSKRPIGDAMITETKGIALGILTADCAPILIYDRKNKIIAAIHAGWKGALKKIVQKTIIKIKKMNKKTELFAVIGPCIFQNSYEIKRDFLNKFLKDDKKNLKYFKNLKDKLYFDLRCYIIDQMLNLGVKNIDLIRKDTFNENNNFFSARSSTYKKTNDYGRNISIIMIR